MSWSKSDQQGVAVESVAAKPRVDACTLCAEEGGELVWQGARARVVRVADHDYPGVCRVIWTGHVSEMTDLPSPDRAHLWALISVVETGLRDMLEPDKINLASLGNVVPHLHWHVIPRWRDDRHFPDPIWAAARSAQWPPENEPERAAHWRARTKRSEQIGPTLNQLLTLAFPW